MHDPTYLAAFLQPVLRDESFVELRARHMLGTHSALCDRSLGQTNLAVADWVISFGVGVQLPTSCLSTYLDYLHALNTRGIIISWDGSLNPGAAANNDTSGTEESSLIRSPRNVTQINVVMQFLGYKPLQIHSGRTGSQRKSGTDSEWKSGYYSVMAYKRLNHTVVRQQSENKSEQCNSDGSFVGRMNLTWPLSSAHYLDEGIARVISDDCLKNSSLLDVGAGSGQYGAYFEKRRRSNANNRPQCPNHA